ncbi:hypothetical protein ACFO5R_13775 [Halosolutus amylolyticus]|uniref:Uncharacterized protein n=1 Tax=Halosolutus amylolyticus TaxID=2932267 RepID=A0ABD5PR89_9EURY|nr:hypothetical protein [Halosolutus amylolyticus]
MPIDSTGAIAIGEPDGRCVSDGGVTHRENGRWQVQRRISVLVVREAFTGRKHVTGGAGFGVVGDALLVLVRGPRFVRRRLRFVGRATGFTRGFG